MKIIPSITIGFGLGVALAASASAQTAAGWSAPAQLTPSAFYFDLSVNPTGDSAAAWADYSQLANKPFANSTVVLTRSKSAGASFGPRQSVPPSDGQVINVDLATPRIHVDPAGVATTVYVSNNDVWTADRPKGGQWQTARRLTGGNAAAKAYDARVRFNTGGDAVVAWTDVGSGGLYVAVRRAGSAWSAARRVAPGFAPGGIIPIDVAISEDGAAVVSFETFEYLDLRRHRRPSNYRLYTAATPSVAGGTWLRSAALLGPDGQTHGGALATADHGRAGLVARRGDNRIVGFTEASAGGTWTAPVLLGPASFTFEPSNYYTLTFASDRAGEATLIGTDQATSTLEMVTANLAAARWSFPAAVSAPHQVNEGPGLIFRPYALGIAPDGFATMAWWNTGGTPKAVAVTRANATAPLSAPTTLVSGGQPSYDIRVAVSSGQHAEVAIGSFDQSRTYKSVLVSTYGR